MKRSILGVAAILLISGLAFKMGWFGIGGPASGTKLPPAPDYSGITVKKTIAQEIKKGTGDQVVGPESEATIVFLGWIYDPKQIGNRGPKFAEVTPAAPFKLTVGKNEPFPGLGEGILGMRADGKRVLIIPPEKGYGSKGSDLVPPGAMLLVEVVVQDVK